MRPRCCGCSPTRSGSSFCACSPEGGEKCVGELAVEVGLDQSPLSQHLAKLREEGLVATRREAQSIFYRIAKPEVLRVLKLLKEIYCP